VLCSRSCQPHIAAHFRGFPFIHFRAGHLQCANLAHRRADHAREGRVPASHIDPADAALLIGDGAQRDVDWPATDQVKRLGAVAGCPDPFDLRLHAPVDFDGARLSEWYVGCGRHPRVGPGADPEDDTEAG
jgi:hypothetical protein